MKLKKFGISAAVLLSFATTQVNAADQVVNGGTIHFKGKFTNAACAVDLNSDGQIVNLGEYRSASYGTSPASGASTKQLHTTAIPFKIQLNDCETTTYKNASFSFSGAAASDNTVFQTSSGSNVAGASGVGIEIRDEANTVLTPGGSYSKTNALTDGANQFNFTARYKAIAENVTPGQANADAVFSIKYN